MSRNINGAQDTDDLIRIVGRQTDNILYVVADQCNALDPSGVEDPRYHAKVNARTYIEKYRCSFSVHLGSINRIVGAMETGEESSLFFSMQD